MFESENVFFVSQPPHKHLLGQYNVGHKELKTVFSESVLIASNQQLCDLKCSQNLKEDVKVVMCLEV